MSAAIETRIPPTFEAKAYRDRQSICHLAFKDLLRSEVAKRNRSATVLDVGCGSGIGRESTTQEWIATQVGQLWGVEPDQEIEIPKCFSQVWRSNLEDANIPSQSVDLAYAFMVLEHVEQVDAFMKRLSDCLKPGGVFLAATINAKCFFARIARITGRIGLQEAVLSVARPQALKDYHYPAVYRMNTRQAWSQLKQKYGFSGLDTLVIDSDEWFAYFPRSVRWSAHVVRAMFQFRQDTYPYLFLRLEK
jgi:2-polyprenyl-3-methyl-5-hydroxy-6-metoxy-1,4-benzoquinol methylase